MSETLRWGILGTASIARTVVPAIQASRNGTVAAVASRDADRAAAWAAERCIPHTFGSYDELLRSGEADLIYCPLPNSLHTEWTVRALMAGLPVLCEKPLAMDAAQARTMAAAAADAGLPLGEGFMYRYHPLYAKLFELIGSGTLGELTSIDAEFSFMVDDPAEIPASAELGGGSLMDVGCYCVHLARWVAGSEPLRVAAFERRDGVDRHLAGLLEFEGGVLARFESSIGSCERHRARIAGTEAAVVIDRPWVQGAEDVSLRIERWGQPDEVLRVPGADAYRLQAEHFVEVCQGRAEPRWPVDDAVANMAVIDALLASAREGRAVPPMS